MLTLFLTEGRELLNRVDAELLVLERTPDARGAIDAVFRAMHSLKGMSATVGLTEAAAALHAGETLLAGARDVGAIAPTHVAALLELHDAMCGALDAAGRSAPAPRSLCELTPRLEGLALRAPAARPTRRYRRRPRSRRRVRRRCFLIGSLAQR